MTGTPCRKVIWASFVHACMYSDASPDDLLSSFRALMSPMQSSAACYTTKKMEERTVGGGVDAQNTINEPD